VLSNTPKVSIDSASQSQLQSATSISRPHTEFYILETQGQTRHSTSHYYIKSYTIKPQNHDAPKKKIVIFHQPKILLPNFRLPHFSLPQNPQKNIQNQTKSLIPFHHRFT
jgi:hypothetical protein